MRTLVTLLLFFGLALLEEIPFGSSKLLWYSENDKQSFIQPTLFYPVINEPIYTIDGSFNYEPQIDMYIRAMVDNSNIKLSKSLPHGWSFLTTASKRANSWATLATRAYGGMNYTCEIASYYYNGILSFKRTIPSCAGAAIKLSDDGSNLAFVVFTPYDPMQPPEPTMYVYFGATQTLEFNVPQYPGYSAFEGALSINDDGSIIALTANLRMYVFDHLVLRWNASVATIPKYTPAAFAISANGDYLAYSWEYLTIMKYQPDQKTYVPIVNTSITQDYYVGWLAMSRDGSYVSVASIHIDTKIIMLQLFRFTSDKPVWSFVSQPAKNPYQDTPSCLVMHKNVIGMTSWGDANNNSYVPYFAHSSRTAQTNPTIYLFTLTSNVPFFTYRTNGSMTALDIFVDNVHVYVHAVGVSTHMNVANTGAAQYAFLTSLP